MRTRWSLITESAPWPPRDSPGATVLQGRMWLLGGFQLAESGGFRRLNDVWSSPDGIDWAQVVGDAPWPARNLAGCVTFNDRIWLLGGFDGRRTFADIWSTDDGRHWDRIATDAPWGARGAFGCTVFRDRIWVIGGVNLEGEAHYGDVWSSVDGVEWEQVTNAPGWQPRAMHPALVFDAGLWILGGGTYHDRGLNHSDVWRSSDGVEWECVPCDAAWKARRFHTSMVHGGRMWVLGGAADGSVNLNDVWCSADGIDWTPADRPVPWGVRHASACLSFGGRAWLLGGFSGELAGNIVYNDIWTMETTG
ncbi:MAG: galactose oxidase [Candidatus Latescibacteria bacterium]|nr:galactose oxidase [Candidatus Latescibacterota bacterium]